MIERGSVMTKGWMTPVERAELAPGYVISRVIKGNWQLAGGHGVVDRPQALADMARFVNAGITTLDCADPEALAAFYRAATGLEPAKESDGEFAGLRREDGFFFGFQRVDGYRAPQWPDQAVPQQSHLDFVVDDLDEAEAELLALGATKPEHQPGGDRWRVLVDPAGHPFCLTLS